VVAQHPWPGRLRRGGRGDANGEEARFGVVSAGRGGASSGESQ
jgi:hypothetical protein